MYLPIKVRRNDAITRDGLSCMSLKAEKDTYTYSSGLYTILLSSLTSLKYPFDNLQLNRTHYNYIYILVINESYKL